MKGHTYTLLPELHREVHTPHHVEMSPDMEINLTNMEGLHEEVDAYVNGIGKNIEDVNQKVRISHFCNYVLLLRVCSECVLRMFPW